MKAGGKSQSFEALYALLESHLDDVYDLICHVVPNESQTVEVLQSVLRKASRRYSKDNYQRYLGLWMMRLTVETIRKKYHRFLYEQESNVPREVLDDLSLEERLVLLLRDRRNFTAEEIASVMAIPMGRVGRSLTYAREKVARQLLRMDWYRGQDSGASNALLTRVELNLAVGEEAIVENSLHQDYIKSIEHVHNYVGTLKVKRFGEIENAIRLTKILPIFSRPASFRWVDLSWQYKLAIEAAVLGVVGLFAVVALPWLFSHLNQSAITEGRFADAFSRPQLESFEKELEEISTDRLLASTQPSSGVSTALPQENVQEDEFANFEFPSGDAEHGAAPVAPSRQNAAVYRLIVQSSSPRDLMPKIKQVLADASVKERELSGKVMASGVFFDGVTSEGRYVGIKKAIENLAVTKSYSTHPTSRDPNERARIIVWIQQI